MQERRFFPDTYAPTGGRMYLSDDNACALTMPDITVEGLEDLGTAG